MAQEKRSAFKEITKGIISENPVLRLVLGTCPTLAVSTSAKAALGMGVAATLVLICSNTVISALRKVIPDKARIPAFITIIAGFVSIVQLLVKAYAPSIDESLGIYLPLIVVNCIILGRAEAFASKNPVLLSACDGLGMGIGFTAALFVMGCIREFLGTGAIFDMQILPTDFDMIIIFILPPGGFFVFGMLMAVVNRFSEKKGLKVKEGFGCEACPLAGTCAGAKMENEKMIITACGCEKKEPKQTDEIKTEEGDVK